MFGNVSDLLKRARKGSGLSQEAAAEKAGVSARAVVGWESGTVSPRVSDFVRLLSLYGIDSLDALCRFVAGEEPEPADEIREHSASTSSHQLRHMAELTERLEALERIIAADRKARR